MMRALFWILLLCNVIFFAAMRWGVLPSDERAAQAQPALHEEKIRLLGAPPAALPASAPTAAPAAPPPLALEPNAPACLEWGDFSGADLARAATALSALQLGDKLGQRQIEHGISYWVYIPPLKNKAAVNKKIDQLKTRGIEEYFVMQDEGPWLNAISLGVFRTQEAAQDFLDKLHTKDVRSAQVGTRAGNLKATVFVLRGLDAATGARLAAIQKDFPGSELKNVSCALTK
ncbi:MAG: SPOR domain-containing protein [Gallionella sp.]|nr:MAG: SPOR domain-containing protein [Gallionella sp.]